MGDGIKIRELKVTELKVREISVADTGSGDITVISGTVGDGTQSVSGGNYMASRSKVAASVLTEPVVFEQKKSGNGKLIGFIAAGVAVIVLIVVAFCFLVPPEVMAAMKNAMGSIGKVLLIAAIGVGFWFVLGRNKDDDY